ncbi:AAA family ATPase [Nonomuraea fuscirosea]|uniref:AAA family ATPase n=1 Tax=Nonomuraea fuscirosea TaxID=1291556 RepID=UPI0033D59A72
MDAIPDLLETPVAILTIATAITAIVTFAFDSTTLARQYPDAYQRVSGVVLVTVGIGLTVAAVWQARRELPLRWDTPTYGAGVMFAVGLSILTYGVWRIRRAPASEEVNRIKRVARGVLAYLDSIPTLSPFDTGSYVELSLQRRASSRRKVPAIRTLARVGRDPTVLYGSLAAGKSTVLRRLARVSCEAAQHKRRPRWIAIYVDLRDPTLLNGSLTPDALREHIARTLGATDGLIRQAVGEALVQHRRARCRLLLLFDSLEALGDVGSAQVEASLNAIRRLVDDNANLRAVVATRDHMLVNRAAWPVRRFSPLSERQQLAFIRAAGLVRPLWTLHRLRGHGDKETLLTSPLLLSLLCRHLARYPQDVEADLDGYRLLAETVDQMLDVNDKKARTTAAELARHMPDVGLLPMAKAVAIVSAVAPPPLAAAGLDTLITCGLLRSRAPGVVEFPHRIFREYFAAQWLLSNTDVLHAKALLADPSWRLPIVMALQHGTAKLTDELLEAVKSILVGAATAPEVVDDVAPFLILDPSTHIASGIRNFRWTPESHQSLRLISQSGIVVPKEIRALADRLVVSAFIHGTRIEQLRAVECIPCMNGQAGAWITRRIYHSKPALGSDFVDSVTRILLDAPHVFASLSPYGRIEAITVTSTSSEAITIGLGRTAGITSDTGTLPGTLRHMLSILQVGAAIMVIAAAFRLISALATRAWPDATFFLLLLILAAHFLVGAALRIPPPTWLYQISAASAMLAFMLGIILTLRLPILLTTSPGSLVGTLIIDPASSLGLRATFPRWQLRAVAR